MLELVWLIPALPLAGFLFLLAFGRRLGEPTAGWLATLAMAGSFAATIAVFAGLVDRGEEDRVFTQVLFEWIPAGDFSVDVGFYVDPLSVTMCLFITGVGTLIHLYAIGYMHGDEKYSTFFVYLNLFAFAMLMLVLGDNLLLTFLGWEGVGVCSYLLISFWFDDPANASAGKKAFVTNRVGDWGFMVAMFLLFATIGSIQYVDVLGAAPALATGTATALTLLLLVGAVGKSAQFPLYLWLPDAMAGPTPVSALIHAATMVTAGVYLLTRMNPVLAQADSWATTTIAVVGAATALFAATIALAQNDIKRVLAYSTVSQLGYMFMAVGVGAYVPAVFHMVTHAFFKALLFLGAGSVIHGMAEDQDMRHYGGLRKLMPITAVTFIVAWLAIAGVPPFSGFWSKDEILLYAWDFNPALWAVGFVTAILTAIYMSRQVVLTFFGRYRYGDPRPEEVEAAWDRRLEVSRAAFTDADATLGDARPGLSDAQGALASATEAAADAEEALASADDEHRESAEAELAKARDNVVTAEAGVADVTSAVTAAEAALEEARLASMEASSDAASRRRVSRMALFREPSAGPVSAELGADHETRLEHHPHESPWTMTAPLVVLAVAAAVGGLMNLPFDNWWHHLEHWLEPSLFGNERHIDVATSGKWLLGIVAIAGAAIGIAIAIAAYLRGRLPYRRLEPQLFANGWFYDRAVSDFMGGPGRRLFDLVTWFDRTIIDGAVNAVPALVARIGNEGRRLQTGFVRSYAAGIGIGAVVLLGYFLLRATW